MALVNERHERPDSYHTLLNNCTADLIGRWQPAHDRVGLIDTDVGFEETRRRNQINDRAHEAEGREDSSARIRHRGGEARRDLPR